MKAITFQQPFAELIMIGAMPYTFRTEPLGGRLIGERVGIHAGPNFPTPEQIDLLAMDVFQDGGMGHGLNVEAAKDLVRHIHCAAFGEGAWPKLPLNAVVGTAILGRPVKCTDLYPGDAEVSTRMWAWPMTDIIQFPQPVAARGGKAVFWEWPETRIERRVA